MLEKLCHRQEVLRIIDSPEQAVFVNFNSRRLSCNRTILAYVQVNRNLPTIIYRSTNKENIEGSAKLWSISSRRSSEKSHQLLRSSINIVPNSDKRVSDVTCECNPICSKLRSLFGVRPKEHRVLRGPNVLRVKSGMTRPPGKSLG